MSRIDRPVLSVFLILLGSYPFFWHSRDWNTSSRLMLTYALLDRGTVSLDGLEGQTGDIARLHSHYYSDKLPGYPMLAAVPYAVLKWGFGVPPHPLGEPGMTHWVPDYWITLGTSGLLTAWAAALLVGLARDLGCTPRASIVVGLAYGLSTPAYVYATLAYGHQASAFALLASFLMIWRDGGRRAPLRLAAAGFLAALASAIELQVAPVSAILGIYLIVEVARRRHRAVGLLTFAAGAAIPTLAMLGYNVAAFGSPWDMGYFHHINFAHVHNPQNPLGLLSPNWALLRPLLVWHYRGLLVFAPILALAVPGWIALGVRRQWAAAIVSFLVCGSVLLVNLSYPEWTGGWSTGPRLLLPMIPFAMIPVAGLIAGSGRAARAVTLVAAGLAILGGVEMFLYQGAGGRVPNLVWDVDVKEQVGLTEPLRDAVWPLWTGKPLPPQKRYIHDFTRNLVAMAAPGWVAGLPPRWRFLQMLPLAMAQVLAIMMLARAVGPRSNPTTDAPSSPHPPS